MEWIASSVSFRIFVVMNKEVVPCMTSTETMGCWIGSDIFAQWQAYARVQVASHMYV